MVPGYRFFQAMFGNKDVVGAPRPVRLPISFQCVRQYDPAAGKWNLYDSDLSSLGG